MRSTGCSSAARSLFLPTALLALLFTRANAQGTVEWARQFNHGVEVSPVSCTYDLWGNIYLTGYFSDSLQVDDTTLLAPGAMDLYLMKLDSVGQLVWIQQGNAAEDAIGRCVKTDDEGNVYLGVDMGSDMNIDDVFIPLSPGYMDMLLLKFNPDGHLLWYRKSHGDHSYLKYLDVDGQGSVVAICQNAGTNVFETDTIIPIWSDHIVLVKYHANGDFQWTTRIDDATGITFEKIAVDSSGNTYAVGKTGYHTVYGDEFTYNDPPAGGKINVVKIGPDGHFDWVRRETVSGDHFGVDLAVHNEHLYTTTSSLFEGTMGYGPITIADTGNMFGKWLTCLIQYDTSGTFNWLRYDYGALASLGDVNVSEAEVVTVVRGGLGNLYLSDTTLYFDAGGEYQSRYTPDGDRTISRIFHKGATREMASLGDRMLFYGVFRDTLPLPPYELLTPMNGASYLYQERDPALVTSFAEPAVYSAIADSYLYPNPTEGQVHIQLQLEEVGRITLTLHDALGRTVMNEHPVNTALLSIAFDTAPLAAGAYFVRIQAGSRVFSKPFIRR